MKARSWVFIGGVVFAGLLVCGGAGGILIWRVMSGRLVLLGDNTDSPTPSEVQSQGRFSLPPSTKGLQAHLEGFQDSELWARFTISPADEASLWTSSLCSASIAKENKGFEMHGINRAWWTPDTAKVYTFRQGERPGVVQKILIDKSNAGEYTVFVETLEY